MHRYTVSECMEEEREVVLLKATDKVCFMFVCFFYILAFVQRNGSLISVCLKDNHQNI